MRFSEWSLREKSREKDLTVQFLAKGLALLAQEDIFINISSCSLQSNNTHLNRQPPHGHGTKKNSILTVTF